jgi:hypothetical protein
MLGTIHYRVNCQVWRQGYDAWEDASFETRSHINQECVGFAKSLTGSAWLHLGLELGDGFRIVKVIRVNPPKLD